MKVREITWKRCNQIGNPNMSFDEDSAVFHRMATLGVCILDPTRTMSLIPSILSENASPAVGAYIPVNGN